MSRTSRLLAKGGEYVSCSIGPVRSWELRSVTGASEGESRIGPDYFIFTRRAECVECGGRGSVEYYADGSYDNGPDTRCSACEECSGGTTEESLVSSTCDETTLAQICYELLDAGASPNMLPIDSDVADTIVLFEPELHDWMYREKQGAA